MSHSSSETALADLAGLWRIRCFEETVTRLRVEEQIAGSVHLCIGQEAIPVGACAALDLTRDAVFATYRGHGWALACGAGPAALFAELLGRETGTNGGRAGSAYLSDPDHGFYGENSIVGAGGPIAVGAALAARYDGSGRVALTVFGDGAMNQGAVHEAMNMASAFDLSVVFLVENNRYSELTPIAAMVRDADLVTRSAAYGMPGTRVDGNDVDAVRRAVAEAVDTCRSGRGPVLIEAHTQRLVGHYIGDAQVYRPRDEVELARTTEPIVVLTAALRAAGVSDTELTGIETRVRAEIETAAATALAAPPADPSAVKEHVYG
ncbi:thiamine pyrophosphate-dependent dehydrogenase E1 component subunit alpha [Nonomuraea angiospora]|uniref:Pyruvate dehydrogenase E1 component alpha subunit n=1 Tax=Nonomuraea angiospora TaxID=46172 RepID=A0ABR9LNK4_9ACTN|nr:thiamine pyrophosphate-dependent dehydrogenase E1 component subunit alpha [Nonomuraea angiospora]MBE1582226.1 pyruvate dehydrogenase E1 component alpha subunit [Nonomuraea angiospora]